ncbi:MAG: PQQ-binding-like beta-propeller repeat protein, partial [Planctomycetaceae bacterium]|nr:PQQ-binding-like beta-propeller repeat protein [Planctomycetaceae bacterium]
VVALAMCCSLTNGDVLGADWPTHRGNLARTGCVDGQPGPMSARVIWVHKSSDHYIAAPVPTGDSVLVSALAAFNTSTFQSLSVDPAAKQRVRWAKSVPYLKLPTVCAPAVAGNLVVFGDGMHQTDGAVLHGVRLDAGLPLWQLPVPGQLVHLEGAPTIAGGKVFIGGGNAGVLCVDTTRLELDGKEVDAAAAQTMLDKRWKELLAKYEQEKKTDPDFAIPPSEDSLPKPRPKLAWQVGAGKWHVDAAVAVVGDRVLAATAFLDVEQSGLRALHCLKVGDGSVVWKTPLKFNPWAGPTVVGDLVLVGCSSVRLEPKDVGKAQGEVLAISLADGSVKWRKELAAGVVSAVAVKDQLAVFTATDGRVRAWDIVSGQEKWSVDGSAPYFASPAIAGNTAYVADLKGVVKAISLADGKPVWTFDLASEPAVQAPGMVYGGPVVSGGRLFVATCNLESGGKASTAVVCLGNN